MQHTQHSAKTITHVLLQGSADAAAADIMQSTSGEGLDRAPQRQCSEVPKRSRSRQKTA